MGALASGQSDYTEQDCNQGFFSLSAVIFRLKVLVSGGRTILKPLLSHESFVCWDVFCAGKSSRVQDNSGLPPFTPHVLLLCPLSGGMLGLIHNANASQGMLVSR